jgi:hypothetical protein
MVYANAPSADLDVRRLTPDDDFREARGRCRFEALA